MMLMNAGYRELAFTKSLLIEQKVLKKVEARLPGFTALAGSKVWEEVKKTWTYDPKTDNVVNPEGRGFKVSREGEASKQIILDAGFTDDDCQHTYGE